MKTELVGGVGHLLIPENSDDVRDIQAGLCLPKYPYQAGVHHIGGSQYVWLMTMHDFVIMREELMFAPARDMAMTPEQWTRAEERYIRSRTGVQQGRIEVVVSNFAVRTLEEADAVRKALRRANEPPVFLIDKTTGRLTRVWSDELED